MIDEKFIVFLVKEYIPERLIVCFIAKIFHTIFLEFCRRIFRNWKIDIIFYEFINFICIMMAIYFKSKIIFIKYNLNQLFKGRVEFIRKNYYFFQGKLSIKVCVLFRDSSELIPITNLSSKSSFTPYSD